jgi:hypothetical protein
MVLIIKLRNREYTDIASFLESQDLKLALEVYACYKHFVVLHESTCKTIIFVFPIYYYTPLIFPIYCCLNSTKVPPLYFIHTEFRDATSNGEHHTRAVQKEEPFDWRLQSTIVQEERRSPSYIRSSENFDSIQ